MGRCVSGRRQPLGSRVGNTLPAVRMAVRDVGVGSGVWGAVSGLGLGYGWIGGQGSVGVRVRVRAAAPVRVVGGDEGRLVARGLLDN